MTNANPLHLSDDHDDVVVDMTTAPEEWAFFPAHASRIGRRGRLKLVKQARDAGPRVEAVEDTPPVAEPEAEEAPSDEASVEREPVREASAALEPVDDEAASDDPVDEEPVDDDGPTLAIAEAVSIEAPPSDVTDDEATHDDEPADELPHEDVIPLVAESVDAESPPAPRKPAKRKPSQRKPAARKTPARAKPKKPATAAARVRAARTAASDRVRAETDTPRVVEKPETSPERSSVAKRLLLAALAVVVASVGAGSWYLYLRDDAPATPAPSVSVDPMSAYAQGAGGVTAGSELGFRAVFPGSPERDTYRLPGPDEDSKVRFDSLSYRSADVELEAVRIAVPDSVDVSDASSVLRNVTDTSARIREGNVADYGELMVNGDPAAASIVSTEDGSYVQTQTILHEETLYLVRVESKQRTHPAFNRFAGEFEIV